MTTKISAAPSEDWYWGDAVPGGSCSHRRLGPLDAAFKGLATAPYPVRGTIA
jgi:hypothetical protein